MSAAIEVNGVFYQDVYYMPMTKGRGADSKGQYEVKDPPNCGWSRALVVWPEDDGSDIINPRRKKRSTKRVTVFCPYTMSSYQVSVKAREVANQRAYPLTPDLIGRLETIINRNWKANASYGFQKSYDVAALVLQRLGCAVPNYMTPALENLEFTEDVVPNRHGKPVGEKLLRPVSRDSKRGIVAAFFLEQDTGSIREAMAKFDMSRSGILTHLHGLHKDHGLGYVLQGDVATIMLPPGCDDPLADAVVAKKAVATQAARRAGKELGSGPFDLPKKGKRREVALAMLEEIALQEVADKVPCSLASVKSHLHDLHTKHGFGYELSDDKTRGKLITPDGWTEADPTGDLDPLA